MFAHAVGGDALPAPPWLLSYIGGRAGARHGGVAAGHLAAGALRRRSSPTPPTRSAVGPGHVDRAGALRRRGRGGDRRTRLERRQPRALARARWSGGSACRSCACCSATSCATSTRSCRSSRCSTAAGRDDPERAGADVDRRRVPRRLVVVPARLPPARIDPGRWPCSCIVLRAGRGGRRAAVGTALAR